MIETLNKHPMYLLLYEIDKEKDENKKINNYFCDFFDIDKSKFFLYKKTEDEFIFYDMKLKRNNRFNFFKIRKNSYNDIIFTSQEHLIESTLNKEERYLKDSESIFYHFKSIFKNYGQIYSTEQNIIELNKFDYFLSDFEKDDFGNPIRFVDRINNSDTDDKIKNYMMKTLNEITFYKKNTQIYYEKIFIFRSNTELNNIFKKDLFNV